ncbi:MAG: hypothetical protein HQM16_05035 [Deltaproteobacteria bacterium]|nr:hypothetical protein [Deltaproteobacteria bacterium]
MSEYKMLGELVCYCHRCKLNLNHRITLMDGNMPARVLCLTCQAEHRYRKTPDQIKEAQPRKAASNADKSKARQSREEDVWRQKLDYKDVTPHIYNMNDGYMIDDRVLHPKFGLGLVIGFDFPDKVHIFFGDEVKILKAKKRES